MSPFVSYYTCACPGLRPEQLAVRHRPTSLQNLFTGTVAKVASLIAIVIGGYQFAHGEPGAKKKIVTVLCCLP